MDAPQAGDRLLLQVDCQRGDYVLTVEPASAAAEWPFPPEPLSCEHAVEWGGATWTACMGVVGSCAVYKNVAAAIETDALLAELEAEHEAAARDTSEPGNAAAAAAVAATTGQGSSKRGTKSKGKSKPPKTPSLQVSFFPEALHAELVSQEVSAFLLVPLPGVDHAVVLQEWEALLPPAEPLLLALNKALPPAGAVAKQRAIKARDKADSASQ
ncbi:unnamed protein product, partial [Symbiodinium sp. KB8]